MTKSSIKKTLTQAAKGAAFINQHQLKLVMGWGNDRTSEVLKGLDFIRLSRTKQYLIDDVARVIAEQVERVC